ncbi:MAG TPA: CRISPR-associated protein Cas5 [Niabella sp.]|nr:CRISPR-associated protein Cas5 [Niabella sp.]
MRFLKIKCQGSFNSYRQPDFHTYHKTLTLPPKTTIAGLMGSALGICPAEVNEEWLLTERFKMGIVGAANGQANDLWQIRKYESKQIKAYQTRKESTPYKTAVIVRELLYQSKITLYLYFENSDDYDILKQAFQAPKWALSLGREDELIKIITIEDVELIITEEEHRLKETVVAGDLMELNYRPQIDTGITGNILNVAPKTVSLPISFIAQKDSEVRTANEFKKFTFIGSLPVLMEGQAFWDESDNVFFQIF